MQRAMQRAMQKVMCKDGAAYMALVKRTIQARRMAQVKRTVQAQRRALAKRTAMVKRMAPVMRTVQVKRSVQVMRSVQVPEMQGRIGPLVKRWTQTGPPSEKAMVVVLAMAPANMGQLETRWEFAPVIPAW
jgi:DNA-binding phage protein